jgi:hypothetical protein
MPFIYLSEECRDALAATALVLGADRRLAEGAWNQHMVYVDATVFMMLLDRMTEHKLRTPEDAVMHLIRSTEVPEN